MGTLTVPTQIKKIPSATIVKKAWDSTDDNILG